MKLPRYVVLISAAGSAVGLFVLFKDRVGGSKYTGDERIAGRTVIITGANSGIGKATSEELARRGGRIIMACRDMENCEKVRQEIVDTTFNKNVHCRKLDLGSLKSIRDFADTTNKSEKRIDILINNAGVMHKDRTITEDGFESHLGINYLGHFLLTNLLLDKIVDSTPSRIINVASVGYQDSRIDFADLNGDQNYDPKAAYKQSKLAVVMFTVELAKRLQDKGVTVSAVDPRLVDTNLRRHFGTHKSYISSVLLRPLWLTIFKTPVQGSQTILYCALDPTLTGKTGHLYTECQEVRIDDKAVHEERLKRLWAVGERWTHLKD